ncbi:MAG: ribonuclease H-like domain-containing protein [Burkholderiales bacterium]
MPAVAATGLRDRLLRLRQSSGTPATPCATTPQPSATLPNTLAERIERMRLPVARDLHVSRDADLARIASGRWLAPQLLAVERRLQVNHVHGSIRLDHARNSAHRILETLGVTTRDPGQLVFFDTETNGLAGGTGTLAFLIGLARYEDDCLCIRQLLITSFAAETALIEAVRSYVSAGSCLVSYNGKSFDAPLVRTRARLARASDPLGALEHIDLLHPVRRAFRREWPNCRLRTAEERALGFTRVDDLPGSLVPEVFRRFMRFGDVTSLPKVLEHNRLDLVSLAALLEPLAEAP